MRARSADSLGKLDQRRREDRRALLVGLALSLGAHLALTGIPFATPNPGSAGRVGPATEDGAGMRVLTLAPPRALAVEVQAPPLDVAEVRWEALEPSLVPPVRPGEGRGSTSAPALLLRNLDERLGWDGDAPPAARALAEGRLADALAEGLARASGFGADSLSLDGWEGRDVSLQPGVLSVGGISVPFCGGPDVERCGFGALPWDLERADFWARFHRGLESQARWETLRERGLELRRRLAGTWDSIGGR